MCAPPFETYFFQFHALFTWKQDVRPPICDKTAPPHLENPGSATGKSEYWKALYKSLYW